MTVESTTQALCDLALRFGEGDEESMVKNFSALIFVSLCVMRVCLCACVFMCDEGVCMRGVCVNQSSGCVCVFVSL